MIGDGSGYMEQNFSVAGAGTTELAFLSKPIGDRVATFASTGAETLVAADGLVTERNTDALSSRPSSCRCNERVGRPLQTLVVGVLGSEPGHEVWWVKEVGGFVST